MKTFTFDQVVSSDYGVGISGDGVFNAPEKVYTMQEIPGRNGDLAVYENRFANITVKYPAFVTKNFKANIQGLRNALLAKTGYKRLTDTYHADEFRLGIYAGGLDVDPGYNNLTGKFDIEFNCKPQRFLTSGETAQTFTTSGSITNPTLFPSRPLLVVTGIGEVGMGDHTITIGGTTSRTVHIDCELMDAWYMDGSAKVSYNEYVTYSGNKIPELKQGANGITKSSGISSIVITPRWWRI